MSAKYRISRQLDVTPKTPSHTLVMTIRPREVKDITLKLAPHFPDAESTETTPEVEKPDSKVKRFWIKLDVLSSSLSSCEIVF